MHRPGQFLGQRGVDPAVALDAGQAGEDGRYDFDPEMTLPALSGAGMAGVKMGLVDDEEPLGSEGALELGADSGSDGTSGRDLRHGFTKPFFRS